MRVVKDTSLGLLHDLQDEIFKSHQDIEDLKKENEEQLSKIENLRQIIT